MATVHSFARALGERCITNDALAMLMTTSDEWIVQRSGIKTRYWVDAGTTTSDLALRSAQRTISLLAAQASSIDSIIVATLSPDYYFPGVGVLLQQKLGLTTLPAFDIRQQCSGFLYGLEMAQALVDSGKYKRILLVGAEVHSNALDISDRGRDVAVLFGDGAGSCIVESSSNQANSEQPNSNHRVSFEIIDTELHSEGAGAKELWCEGPGSSLPHRAVTPEVFATGRTFPQMNGRRVFESAVRRMVEVSHSILARNGIAASDLKLFVPHQANLRINLLVAEQLGLSSSQVFSTIEKYGNTTAATIPIGMCDALTEIEFVRGDLILQAAFGSGYTWGAALLKVL